jgi:septal ring factor EnvC (AmiA/AmiB activator)
MESSPSKPIASRQLNTSTHSGSSISSRNQYQHSNSAELPNSNGYAPQQQQQNGRAESNAVPPHQQAPFFERVGVRGDVKVVQNYSRIVKQQNARLRELEKFHKELEARLEVEATQKDLLEATLEQREREWELRLERTVAEREHFKQKMNEERAKNDSLLEQLSRKDQVIHGMMQRKVRAIAKRMCTPRPTTCRFFRVDAVRYGEKSHQKRSTAANGTGPSFICVLESSRRAPIGRVIVWPLRTT